MDDKELEKIRKQHADNYKNIILDLIANNTIALIEDIKTMIKKPPLETMDIIKSRFLSLAKKNKIVLDTESLDAILESFRKDLFDMCNEIKKIRIDNLNNLVNKVKLEKTDVIKLSKKDFNDINKNIRRIFKDKINVASERIINEADNVFNSKIEEEIRNKIVEDVSKYIKNIYLKQMLDNFDNKMLIKDTTLINNIKEQAERYRFTLNNSHIFNDLNN